MVRSGCVLMLIVSSRLLWNRDGNDGFDLFWRLYSRTLWNHYRCHIFIMFRTLSSRALWEHRWSIHIRVFWTMSRRTVWNDGRLNDLYSVCCGTLRRECGHDRFGLYGTLLCRNLVGWRSIGV